jgi:ABC-type multidrug transport system fused ATPase/permease subunit
VAGEKKKNAIKLTLPIVKHTLYDNRGSLLVLLLISAVLSFVPTIKSDLESSLISEIDAVLHGRTQASSLHDVAITHLHGLSTPDDKNADWPEKLARLLFPKLTVASAFFIYLLIAFATFILEVGASSFKTGISKQVFSAIRGAGLRKGLVTDPDQLPDVPNVPGQYAMAIQQGAANVGDTYGYFLDAGQELFALGTTLLLVATRSLAFAGCCLLLVMGQVATSIVQAHRLQRQRQSLDSKRNDLLGRTDDILRKREIILAYEQQHRYSNKLDLITRDFAKIERTLEVKEQVFRGCSALISEYGKMIILVLALIITLGLSKSAVNNIGDAYFLISIYVRIFVPSSNLLNRYDSLRRSESTSNTFLGILSQGGEASEGKPHSAPVGPKMKNLMIDFRDVDFRYSPARPWVLRNCSLTIPANSTTLVVGKSGSGKTTIARLILGFWTPSTGHITVGGKDVLSYPKEELRLQMSYLSQNDHIVEDTVRENLSWVFGNGPAPDSQLVEALLRVEIVETVEEGTRLLNVQAKDLSIGQQQRLSIARLLLDDSPIQILDEPLTGVDVFTIRDLHPTLSSLFAKRDRTIVMFSHRIPFAAYADHVIVLGSEAVVEQGSPSDLLKKQGGTFAELYHAALAELKRTDAA